MKKSDFYASLHTIAPGCLWTEIRTWIKFAYECVDAKQYVEFTPPKDRESGMEKWLDTLYAGLCEVRKEYGAEMAARIVELSTEKACLYPYEMMQAVKCLQSGGDGRTIMYEIYEGEMEGTPPFFTYPIHTLMERDFGTDIPVKETQGVGSIFVEQGVEPKYVLENGTVLLESNRDETGCYKVDTGSKRSQELYRPVYSDEGQLKAFRKVRPAPENYFDTVDKKTFQKNRQQARKPPNKAYGQER